MMLLLAVALAAAPAPRSASCPEAATAEAFACRALDASNAGKPDDAAVSFEQAAQATAEGDPAKARALAAAGNMWIAAGQPGKAALALDRALAGPGLQAEQRGEALLDRARAAEAQNDLKFARAKLNEAALSVSEDPFYWYFSAALAIRELDKATAQAAIGRALSLAPSTRHPVRGRPCRPFRRDDAKARTYWEQAAQFDPQGPVGKAARDAVAMLAVPVTLKETPQR